MKKLGRWYSTLEYKSNYTFVTYNSHTDKTYTRHVALSVIGIYFYFLENSFSSALKDLDLYMGFGGGRGAAPAGLNRGGGVRSFRASPERFPTTLL